MLSYSAWAVLSLYSTRVFASTADLILCLRSKHVREQRGPMNLEIFSRCRNRHESKQKFLSTLSIDRVEFARNSQPKWPEVAIPDVLGPRFMLIRSLCIDFGTPLDTSIDSCSSHCKRSLRMKQLSRFS